MGADMNLQSWLQSNGGVNVNYGKTSYVARITGEHPKYNLDREFVSQKGDTSYSGKTGEKFVPDSEISENSVYEIRGDSWNNEHRRYVVVTSVDRTGEGTDVETERIESEEDVLNYV